MPTTCSIDGCEGEHKARGWCRKHYELYRPKPSCIAEECKERSYARGHCLSHYREVKPDAPFKGLCSVESCTRDALTCGWCDMHYRRAKKHGDPTLGAQTRNFCSEEGCERPAKGWGLCNKHYQRLNRLGEVDTLSCYCNAGGHYWERPIGRGQPLNCAEHNLCRYPGCENDVCAKDLCATHYSRLYKWGHVEASGYALCLRCRKHKYIVSTGNVMCTACTATARRAGTKGTGPYRPRDNADTQMDYIFARTSIQGECWMWNGPTGGSTPIGRFREGRSFTVRRFLYDTLIGPAPACVIASCGVTTCVNPHPHTRHMDAHKIDSLMRATIFMHDGQMYLEWPEDHSDDSLLK